MAPSRSARTCGRLTGACAPSCVCCGAAAAHVWPRRRLQTARHAQRRLQIVPLQGACSALHEADVAGRWALTQLLHVCGREQHGTDSSVRINDVFFAGHAFCLSALTLCQCVLFERGTQRVHEHTRLAFAIVLPLTVTYAAAAWLFPADISVISCAPPASGAACAHA